MSDIVQQAGAEDRIENILEQKTMKTKRNRVISLILSTMLMAGFASADTIYHELFSTTNTVLTTVGWSGYLGTNGAFTTAANIAVTSGSAWDGGPVNSYPLTVDTNSFGSIYEYVNVNNDTLIITTEYSFSMLAFTNLQFSMRNNFEKATDVRAAIKVEGAWYVSDGVAVQALAGWAGTKLWKVNADGIAWHPLNFTAGSNLVVSTSTVPLPKTGTAQGFGFYSKALPTNDWNRVRADNFMISGDAIPVPTDVIYHELFSTTNTVLTTVGWSGYLGTNGAFTTAANIATTTGIAWDGGPVNSYPLTVATNANGSIYEYVNANLDTLIVTEEYSFSMSAFTNLQFTMRTNFEKATDVRAAIKVDGAWYVSDGVAVPALAGWAGAKLWKVVADGIAWHPLNFTAGGNLVVGVSTVALPKTGTAQSFGFYSEALLIADWNRVRADNFMISGNAIPAPISVGLFVISSLPLIFIARRYYR